VPVGEGVLGHVYNVLGEPLDTDISNIHPDTYWPIHRESPPFVAGLNAQVFSDVASAHAMDTKPEQSSR
jgi:F0F1-type ATP synthase beta subunit